ncbi:MAG: hypothetical protein HQK84_12655 [Nitrospinae bacterium]|nr:hypothetical protein [Nitrospinota bacterium]
MKKPERIVVLGIGKSGTTALYFRIKNSFPKKHKDFFEPKEAIEIAEKISMEDNVIAKILIPVDEKYLKKINDFFIKKVLIVRDPRDIIVSSLLYTGAFNYLWRMEEKYILKCLSLLEKKEENPASLSVIELLGALTNNKVSLPFYKDYIRKSLLFSEKLSNADCFTIKYEDMIENKLREVEEYLGFKLLNNTTIDQKYRRVIRTKKSEDWKNWFLDDDEAFFQPLFESYLKKYGYEPWKKVNRKMIDAKDSSKYVKKIVNEKRALEGYPQI